MATLLPARLIPVNCAQLQLGMYVAELDRSASYVVVCESGARSAQATAYLLQQGYDARSMTGGMAAWRASARAVETGASQSVHA